MFDMDRLTALGVASSVSAARLTPRLSKLRLAKFEKWSKGKKLKMLLVGYNGARNTGADVRVAEMLKQFGRIFGKDVLEISVLTQNIDCFKIYCESWIKLIQFNTIFFRDLLNACSNHHMAVLCEGSTLKSKFANALTLFFCEAAGIMKAQGKPCLAYGSEAGKMDPFVRKIASDLCSETYFIARAKPSLKIIQELGLNGHLGTDTAWTFPAGPKDWAEEKLKEVGWDGEKPVLGAAVINPFWWPVRPSLIKLGKAFATRSWDNHYRKWYFFSSSADRERKLNDYLMAIAGVLDNLADRYGAHIVIVGMEAIDLNACKKLQILLKRPAAIFSAQDYDGYQLASILRNLSLLITSRYHARVLSMGAGVPAIAVSMDERLENIYEEIGHKDDYYIEVSEPDLLDRLENATENMWENRVAVSREIAEKVPHYLELMGKMGMFVYEYVSAAFPDLPLPPPPGSWRDALGSIGGN